MIGIGIGVPFSFSSPIDANAQTIYNRIIADGGVSNLTRLNFFVKGLKAIYGDLANVPVCYDAHWIGYKLGSGTGATAGQAAAKLYSLTVAGDAVQSTAASQPLLLSHNGASTDNYYFQSGTSGNFITSPSATANQITGTVDFDFSFIVQSNNSTIFGKIATNASASSYAVFISTNSVQYIDSLGNYNTIVNISSFLPAVGSLFYVRVTLVGTTATCFTSIDGTNWTSRGTATVAPLLTSNSSSLVFTSGSAATNPQKAYRMRIYNGIRDSGGTLVADCNPSTYNASTSQTAWTSSTGEVWTISTGTATTGYKGVLVDRTIVQSDGVDDTIGVNLIGSGRFTQYLLSKQHGSTTGNEAIAGPWDVSNWRGAIYSSVGKYATYQGSGADGFFGSTITKNIYTEVGLVNSSTGTDWIPNINGTDVTNGGFNIGVQNAFTSINIGSRQGGVTFSNSTINTYMMSNSADTLAKRTAMYNLLKSISNL